MRIILDTNVFIDAIFHDDEDCYAILERESAGQLVFVMTKKTSEELYDMIFEHAIELGCTLQEFHQPFMRLCRTFRRTEFIESNTRAKFCPEDPSDDKFVQCAVDGEVGIIVTRDKHLLSIKTQIELTNGHVVRFIKPEDFLRFHDESRIKALLKQQSK